MSSFRTDEWFLLKTTDYEKCLKGPAAKIHMSLYLLRLVPINSVVTSGMASETTNLPLESAFAVLFLCDAGYEDQKLFHALDETKVFLSLKSTPTVCTKFYGNVK